MSAELNDFEKVGAALESAYEHGELETFSAEETTQEELDRLIEIARQLEEITAQASMEDYDDTSRAINEIQIKHICNQLDLDDNVSVEGIFDHVYRSMLNIFSKARVKDLAQMKLLRHNLKDRKEQLASLIKKTTEFKGMGSRASKSISIPKAHRRLYMDQDEKHPTPKLALKVLERLLTQVIEHELPESIKSANDTFQYLNVNGMDTAYPLTETSERLVRQRIVDALEASNINVNLAHPGYKNKTFTRNMGQFGGGKKYVFMYEPHPLPGGWALMIRGTGFNAQNPDCLKPGASFLKFVKSAQSRSSIRVVIEQRTREFPMPEWYEKELVIQPISIDDVMKVLTHSLELTEYLERTLDKHDRVLKLIDKLNAHGKKLSAMLDSDEPNGGWKGYGLFLNSLVNYHNFRLADTPLDVLVYADKVLVAAGVYCFSSLTGYA